MAIIERKQLTGTTAQINSYAGHNGQLVFDKTTKHLHVLSGTAGTNTKLANVSDVSSKADKSYVDTGLAKKLNTTAKIPYSQITGAPSIPDTSGLIPKTGNRGSLSGYETVSVEGSDAVSVTKDTPDIFLTSGAITAPSFSVWDECWTKIGALLSTNPLVTLNDNWVWSGGVAPTLKRYGLVVFNKTRGLGTATYISRG